MSRGVFNHWLRKSRGPQPKSLHLPTWLRLEVSNFMPWYGREWGESALPPKMLSHGQRIYSLCHKSPTHCLLVAPVFFTKLRGRKANVRRFNRVGGQGESTQGSWKTLIPNQWCTWAPVS
ncbi:hypothetical protein Smp_175890 [Schistosoma mansoni]|uniref:hypothetical protein n=1 Tax=Schistosoma mansoni TaxID=6183 RepID=UPI0001A62A11|nr:hypothetical protein Smp_175890 [Schistosoma mansoni]|eukprot:XP_018653723.1 hypothetical protein Smp_175890 [Schistosoma mansoni]